MKNKIKLFDRGIFFEAINRLKIQGIIGGALSLSSAFILIMSCFVELVTSNERVEIPAEFFYTTFVVPFVIVPMMMMVAFSYLKARKTSDFYHSIPVKRESMYFSTILAAIVWIVAILVIASILPLGVAAFSWAFRIDMAIYWEIMAKVLLASIFVLSCFALGVSLTGNGFTNFFVSLMIVFVPRIIISVICLMAEEFSPFLVLNVGNSLLNNEYNILFDLFDLKAIPFYGTVIYTLVVSCAYLALGALAFVKRKSEMAGKASAFSAVQFVTRMLLPFIALLGSLYFVLYSSCYHEYDVEMYFFSLALAIVAFTIYFIYELITTKKITKVLKSLVWFPALIGGVVIVGIIITIGSKIALAREVDEDRINYIVVEELGFAFFQEEFVKIYDEDAIEIIAEAYNDQMEYVDDYFDDFYEKYDYSRIITIGINQGGTTFYREIYLEYELYEEFMEICRLEVYGNDFKIKLPKYSEYDVDISPYIFDVETESIKNIYNALKDDLEDVDYEEFSEIIMVSNELVSVCVTQYINGDYEYITIPISKKTPKAYKAAIEELQELPFSDNREVYEEFFKYADSGNQITIDFYNMYVVYPEEEDAVYVEELYTYDMDNSVFKETSEIIKTLEENNDSDDYDCIIIIEGWVEIFNPDAVDEWGNYYDCESFALNCKYYVPEDVAEDFVEYIEHMREYSPYY